MKTLAFGNLSLGIPDGWKDLTRIIIAGPPSGGFSPNVTVDREVLQQPLSSAQYAAYQRKALEAEFRPHGYAIQEENATTAGGLEAFQRVDSFRLPNAGIEISQLQILVVSGKEGITITASHRSEHFAQARGDFMEIISWFGVRDPVVR